MSDGETTQAAGGRPSIAEVAAWLRKAAEQSAAATGGTTTAATASAATATLPPEDREAHTAEAHTGEPPTDEPPTDEPSTGEAPSDEAPAVAEADGEPADLDAPAPADGVFDREIDLTPAMGFSVTDRDDGTDVWDRPAGWHRGEPDAPAEDATDEAWRPRAEPDGSDRPEPTVADDEAEAGPVEDEAPSPWAPDAAIEVDEHGWDATPPKRPEPADEPLVEELPTELAPALVLDDDQDDEHDEAADPDARPAPWLHALVPVLQPGEAVPPPLEDRTDEAVTDGEPADEPVDPPADDPPTDDPPTEPTATTFSIDAPLAAATIVGASPAVLDPKVEAEPDAADAAEDTSEGEAADELVDETPIETPTEAPTEPEDEDEPEEERGPGYLARRRAERKARPRLPRGRLRERIGILPRIRAVLGLLLIAAVLGVLLGGAIGAIGLLAFIVVRNAIGSNNANP